MNCIKMWYKEGKCDVDVYEMNTNDKMCLIYNPQLAGKQCGSGWQLITRKSLIPYPYADIYKDPCMTKTKYNKAKSHLHLVEAVWEATDGIRFKHEDIDLAVKYQMILDGTNDE